ncbi:hypothetical protein [Ornithinimicrobium sp. INDO-MA30-4]|uniref:hypothetical protein n=1 Tax=Ornithinimicrobium sp. INDO-MA30-4 TaxID=2908651 RepID=UPI001F1655A5|nr:hypothetical protein [Ornithinimicrobium sp. INDO-MA30-4]UJH70319.1 hypothetical protein L0A91_14445 [Ornithinimicrobium sp. INDO-MA30-4]
MSVDVLGSTFRLEVSTEAGLAQLQETWGRSLRHLDDDSLVSLQVGGQSAILPMPLQQRLTFDMTQIAMAKLAGRAVMLHAGAVSRADGQILALVTESGGGKTTAVIEFARNGWGYVTDETLAVVDGAVLPFPKPLSLVMHPSAPDAKMLVSAEALGLGECPETLSMGHLVLLNRDPAASLPELTPLQPVEAAWRLIPHSSHLWISMLHYKLWPVSPRRSRAAGPSPIATFGPARISSRRPPICHHAISLRCP